MRNWPLQRKVLHQDLQLSPALSRLQFNSHATGFTWPTVAGKCIFELSAKLCFQPSYCLPSTTATPLYLSIFITVTAVLIKCRPLKGLGTDCLNFLLC